MTRRSTIWLVVTSLFAAANAAGAVLAARGSEWPHAGGHVALFIGALYVAGRIMHPARSSAAVADVDGLSDHLTHLEQALDAVAVEVERMGEGQRFMTRLFAEHGGEPAPAASDADRAVKLADQPAGQDAVRER